jgi:hypothetical protein
LRLECLTPSILKPASRPVTSSRAQMMPCTVPNPPLRAQRAPARAGSFFDPERRFVAVQQDARNGGRTGRSADEVRNGAFDPKVGVRGSFGIGACALFI